MTRAEGKKRCGTGWEGRSRRIKNRELALDRTWGPTTIFRPLSLPRHSAQPGWTTRSIAIRSEVGGDLPHIVSHSKHWVLFLLSDAGLSVHSSNSHASDDFDEFRRTDSLCQITFKGAVSCQPLLHLTSQVYRAIQCSLPDPGALVHVAVSPHTCRCRTAWRLRPTRMRGKDSLAQGQRAGRSQ